MAVTGTCKTAEVIFIVEIGLPVSTQANGMVAPTRNGIYVPKCGECEFPLDERGDRYEDYNSWH